MPLDLTMHAAVAFPNKRNPSIVCMLLPLQLQSSQTITPYILPMIPSQLSCMLTGTKGYDLL